MQSTRLLNSPATHVLANINSTLPTLLPSGGLGQLLEYWVQFTIPSLFYLRWRGEVPSPLVTLLLGAP